MAVYFGKFQNL